MKLSQLILLSNAERNIAKNRRMLNFTNEYNEPQRKLAIKEYKRMIIITTLIILLSMVPLAHTLIIMLSPSEYPPGATKEVYGHISINRDIFYYRIGNQKYEFYLDEYNIDDSYETYETFIIYLDDDNNIISFAHQTDDIMILIRDMFIMIIILFVLLPINIILATKFYARNWRLYILWYQTEIEPYKNQENFNEIIANKKYYNVLSVIKNMSEEKKKIYKKYRNRSIIYTVLFICCIVLTIYCSTEFEVNLKNWIFISIIIIYVIIFFVLLNNCDAKMHEELYKLEEEDK